MNNCNYIYLVEDKTPEFGIIYYITIASYLDNNEGDAILWTNSDLSYSLWVRRLIRDYSNRFYIKSIPENYLTEIEKRNIVDTTHKADYIRLRVLLDNGGWYLDLDQILIDTLPTTNINKPIYFGEVELDGSNRSITNRCMYHPKGHDWTKLMISLYDDYSSKTQNNGTSDWIYTSILKPSELWRKDKNQVIYLNPALMDPTTWYIVNLQSLFMHNSMRFDDCIGFHLNENITRRYLQNIDLEHIMTVDTTFTYYVRRYVSHFWNDNKSTITHYTGYKF